MVDSLCRVRVGFFAGKSLFSDNLPVSKRDSEQQVSEPTLRFPTLHFMADHMVLNQATGIIFCPGATCKTSRSCRACLIATITAMTTAR